jgi:hypothetical protein
MGDVGIVVSILAMMIAFGSVFFASAAVKRIEDNSLKLLRSYLDPVKSELADMKASLSDAVRKTDGLEKEMAALRELQGNVEASLRNVEMLVAKIPQEKEDPAD